MNANEKIFIRNATPDDAAAVARIQAAGWEHAFRGIFSDDYLNNQIKRKLESAEWRAEMYRKGVGINIVAIDKSSKVIGHADGSKQDWQDDIPETEKVWQLYALYIDPDYIGLGAVALPLVKEFAKRVATAGFDTFIAETVSESRAQKLYEKMGGRKVGEFASESYENLQETRFEFDVKRFL